MARNLVVAKIWRMRPPINYPGAGSISFLHLKINRLLGANVPLFLARPACFIYVLQPFEEDLFPYVSCYGYYIPTTLSDSEK